MNFSGNQIEIPNFMSQESKPINYDSTWYLAKRITREYIIPHWKTFLVSIALMLVIAGTTSLNAWLIKPALDSVFVEKNTIPDDDDYYLFFWRGYICLDGHTFPIFDMPRSLNNSQETPEQNPHGIDNCTEIKYLEKELGQNVRIPNYSQTNYTVYDEEKKEWLRSQEYYFTPQEARFLVPFYEEPEPDYGYYSD